MKKTYILKLSLKNIAGHKLRSTLTIMGVAIAVGFIIFLISMGFGLQRISTNQIANLEALQIIDVTPGKSKVIEITDDTVNKFEKLSNVEKTAPQLNLVGKVSFGSSISEAVIYGKNIDYLNMEEAQIEAGSLYASDQDKKAVINMSTLKQLGIKEPQKALGQKIKIKLNIGSEFLGSKDDEPLVKEDEYLISGVLTNQSSPYIYIPLENLKQYGVKKYSAAKVMVTDKKYSDAVKRQLENLGYKTASLKDTVDQINQFFAIFQLILLSFGAIAVIVAALGMFNTLTISLLEKTREISFMKVLGTTAKDIWKLFLSEALLIGIIGGTLGIAGGTLLGSALNNFILGLAMRTGNKPVEIFYTPVEIIIASFAIAIALSFLTGIYPSFRASRIDPLEAMRYE